MPLRNGPHGYGTVTKLLHWRTVAALTGQFLIGYTMDVETDVECDPVGEERSGGDTSDAAEERLARPEDACAARAEDAIIALGLLWFESRLEKTLLVLLLVVPGTGLLLVLGDYGWLPLHVAAHLTFFTILALHVGLVLKRTVIQRDRLLQRML